MYHEGLIGSFSRFLVRHRVVNLLIVNGFALGWITDGNTRHTTKFFAFGVAMSTRLIQARIDTTHHLPTDHADFVEKDELCIFQLVLQLVQRFALQPMEVRWLKPVDETMHGGGIEPQIESS